MRQKRDRHLKYILAILIILVTSCMAKKQLNEQSSFVGNKTTTTVQINQFESVFAEWSKLSIPRTDVELQSFDSLTKTGYKIYEELLSDSSFFGIKPTDVLSKYILLPNKLKIRVVDSYTLMFGKYQPIYSDLIVYEIQNFRPEITFPSRPVIYLTDNRIDELRFMYEEYDLSGFFDINLLDNDINYNFVDWRLFTLRFLETSPNIIEIIQVKNSNEFIVYYRIKNQTIAISIKKINNKWTKIKEIERFATDIIF